jgi:hypothetical protein
MFNVQRCNSGPKYWLIRGTYACEHGTACSVIMAGSRGRMPIQSPRRCSWQQTLSAALAVDQSRRTTSGPCILGRHSQLSCSYLWTQHPSTNTQLITMALPCRSLATAVMSLDRDIAIGIIHSLPPGAHKYILLCEFSNHSHFTSPSFLSFMVL